MPGVLPAPLLTTGGGVTASIVASLRTPSDGTDSQSTTRAATIPAGTAVDDYALFELELWQSTATNPVITWPSGFTEIVNYVSTTDGFQKLKVAIKKLTAADSGTYTASWTASHFNQAVVTIVRGIDTTTALDVAINLAQNSTGTAYPSNSLTTATAGCAIVQVVANENTCTSLPPTGYTEQQESNYLKTNTKIGGAAGSESISGGSVSASTLKLVALIALRPAAGGGLTGTVAVTQASDTSAASGQLGYTGTAAATQAANTSAATGTVVNPVTGTAATSQANQASSATGQLGYSGTSARTQANQTSTAAGQLGYSGTATPAQAANTSSASGTFSTGISGSAAGTQAPNTSTASGQLGYSGSASASQAAQTSTATGTFTSAGSFTGTAAVTQANQVGAASGKLGYSGTAAPAQANNTPTASGTVVNPVTGTAAPAQANQTAAASGVLRYTGTLAVSQASNTASIQGVFFIPITGTVAAAQANQTLNASGSTLGAVVIRPNTGTTSRPGSGITPRPFAGVTDRP